MTTLSSFLGKERENLHKAADLYTYLHTYICEACRAKMPIRVRIGVAQEFKEVFGFYTQLLEKSCV